MTGHPEDSVLLDFAGGRLSPAARAEIGGHLAACKRCRGVFEGLTEDTSPSGKRLAQDPSQERTQSGDPLVGMMLGEYRVLQRLGQGGMGALYRGEQPLIGKDVAIKVLLQSVASDPIVVQRMLGEARAANAVRHPNIVDIFSFGQLPDGRPYMVMELLEGLSLAELLREVGRLTPAQTMLVLSQAMAALEAAHAAGVIHRDLKPENIFINPRPEGWVVTLFDFGLAKREGSTERGLTVPGLVMGTPGYMSPEQVKGRADVSAKTDIYAMGVVAWTVLAGREPFAGGSAVEIMRRHLDMPVPPLEPEVKDLPAGLEALVSRMLQKDPQLRPTAAEVRATLSGMSSAPAPAPAPVRRRLPTRVAPPSRPARTGLLLAGITAVGSALVAAGWWVNSEGAQPVPAAAIHAPRPIEPPPPVPASAEEPAPAPVAVEAPVSRDAKTNMIWRCSSVIEVGELDSVVNAPWHVFRLRIEAEPAVLVSAAKTRLGLRQIRAAHKAVSACRGTKRLIAATHTIEHPGALLVKSGGFRGLGVEASALTVIKSVPEN